MYRPPRRTIQNSSNTTMQKADGMMYAPKGKSEPVCKKGDFAIAAIGLDHGHIYGMCNGLVEAGAELKWVYDPDPAKVDKFCTTYPEVKPASSKQQILDDNNIQLVAGAAIPSKRCALGLEVMSHGKDYFTDKAPMTTLEQVEQARAKVKETGRKYAVYYSERLHTECSVYAGKLIEDGAIGRVIQVIGTGPHRLNAASRPDWFFRFADYGGILCDIGSHQIEQFLFLPERRTPRSSRAASQTTTTSSIRTSKISVTRVSRPITVRRIISAWIGLRLTDSAHGVTAAHFCSARTAISNYVSTSRSVATKKATTCTWSITRASSISR